MVEVLQRTGRSVDSALGRRRVDEPLLVHKPNPSRQWWEAQIPIWEQQYVRRRLREHLAMAARVIAGAEAAEADARRAAVVAASAAVTAAKMAVRATMVSAAAQPVAELRAPVLLTEAEAEAPPVELPPAWREWPLPPLLTLHLMEEWLAPPGCGWLRLSQVCRA